MRIGIVCPYDLGSPGGVQQLTIELSEKLRELGDEVVLVGSGRLDYAKGPGRDWAAVPAGRPVFVRGNASRVPLTLSPLSWFRVRGALSDVDVIHSHEPFLPLVGWVALTIDKPVVATFHADAPRWVRSIYERTPLLTGRMSKVTITAASKIAAASIPEDWGSVQVIPNAVDVESYRIPVGRIARRVCFLGRDEPRKGLDVLLEAWSDIRAAVPDAELLVLGVERKDEVAGVRFLGRVSVGEKKRLLGSSSVFVAPNTRGESFGMVLIEALAAGCGVVASDLPAFREVLDDGGVLFPVGDSAALATQVVSLLTDDAISHALRERGERVVDSFDWDVVVQQYRDVYASVAGRLSA